MEGRVGEDVIAPVTLGHTSLPLEDEVDILDEKKDYATDEIAPVVDGVETLASQAQHPNPEGRAKTAEYYSKRAEAEGIAPAQDFLLIVDQMMELTQEEALDILHNAIQYHQGRSAEPRSSSKCMITDVLCLML